MIGLVSCGAQVIPVVSQPAITHFTATPNALEANGGAVLLQWKAENARKFEVQSNLPGVVGLQANQTENHLTVQLPANPGFESMQYKLKLIARGDAGTLAAEKVVNVIVVGQGAVKLKSNQQAVLHKNDHLLLSLEIKDPDLVPEEVKFFEGSTLLGVDQQAPFTWDYQILVPGNKVFQAHIKTTSGQTLVTPSHTSQVNFLPELRKVSFSENPASVFTPVKITLDVWDELPDVGVEVSYQTSTGGWTTLGQMPDQKNVFLLHPDFSDTHDGLARLAITLQDQAGQKVTESNTALSLQNPFPPNLHFVLLNTELKTQPATITLHAQSWQSKTSIKEVRFYANDTLVGTRTAEPYTVPYVVNSSGVIGFKAVAENTSGVTRTESIDFVSDFYPQIKSVSFSSQQVKLGERITVTVDAEDDKGIQMIGLFENDTSVVLGTVGKPLEYVADTLGIRPLEVKIFDTAGHQVTDGVHQVEVLPREPLVFSSIALGESLGCGLVTQEAYCWNNKVPMKVQGGGKYSKISVGGASWNRKVICVLDLQGLASCWGQNSEGALGLGDVWSADEPTRVKSNVYFQDISVGERHVCALDLEGAAYCWGGYGTLVPVPVHATLLTEPTRLDTALRFKKIEVGKEHTCAIATSQEVYCWGSSIWGALGAPGVSQSATPVLMDTALRFTQLSMGDSMTCGTTSTGEGYCWGAPWVNGYTPDAGPAPRVFPVTTPIISMQTHFGMKMACALTTAGKVYCGGNNENKHAGNPAYTNYASPLPAISAVSFKALVTGTFGACALTQAGTLYCWGAINEQTTPTLVP